MVLHLVTKRKGKKPSAIVRALSPEEEAALRAVKAGGDVPESNAVYRATVGYAHGNGYWVLCDCRGEGVLDRPGIPLRRKRDGRIFLVNGPDPEIRHERDCIFGPTAGGTERKPPPVVFRDVLDPILDDEEQENDDEPGDGPWRPWRFAGPATDTQSRTPGGILRTLMRAAGLHRLSVADRFASPQEWLAEIVRAAGRFRNSANIGMSELLFTDPAQWTSGRVARIMDEAERVWPGTGTSSAWLCWVARDLGDRGINEANPQFGRVTVPTDVISPKVGGSRVQGPWLFLGRVARSGKTGRWECRKAFAQPIVSALCPIPVESQNERRAVGALRSLVWSLENNADLAEALGDAVRAELEKPLAHIETIGGPCLPDFILTVARPGGADPPTAGGRHIAGHAARYVIEVMGFDDPEYESEKIETHRRMRNLGRLFRMEAGRFDSRRNDLQRQADRIARYIRNDLLLRWRPD